MMTLDQNQIEEGIAIIIKAANTDILEDVNALADAVRNEGDNAMKEQLLKNCQEFQRVYNDDFCPSINKMVSDFQNVFEIGDIMNKADVGDISSVDASFKAGGVNLDGIRL